VIAVTRTSLETTDIFIGPFLLSNGGNLCGIRIKDQVRHIAAFCIEGEDLDMLDEQYRAGRALVNPARLRDCLNFLRDVLEFREGDAR
jgi:hypothetical protein